MINLITQNPNDNAVVGQPRLHRVCHIFETLQFRFNHYDVLKCYQDKYSELTINKEAQFTYVRGWGWALSFTYQHMLFKKQNIYILISHKCVVSDLSFLI